MATYLTDTFTGSAGTLLTAHTSDSGATWPNDANHILGTAGSIALDGDGMLYGTGGGLAGQLSSITLPTGAFSIIYTLKKIDTTQSMCGITLYTSSPYGSTTTSNLSFMTSTFSGATGSDWFQNGFTTSNTPGFNGTFYPTTGTLYYIKINVLPAYGGCTLYAFYSTDGITWNQQSFHPTWSTTIASMIVAVGPVFQYAGLTATTGVHIGGLIIEDLVTGTPNTIISNAYVTSSGESVAVFSKLSGTMVYPNYMEIPPTIYKNGTSVGDLSTVVPWINPNAYPLIIPLPTGVIIASTDVVTMTTSAGWMLFSSNGVGGAQTNLAVTNYVGISAFGTDSLAKTLRVGVNIGTPGVNSDDYSQVFKNMATRLQLGSTQLPTTLGSAQNFTFYNMSGGQGSQVPSFYQSPALAPDSTVYFALGYDDNYLANSGSATPQLSIISSNSAICTVTQITSCNNTGSGGLNQYYLFQVTANHLGGGMPCFNAPLQLHYPAGSGNSYIQNLWILGPGDFTVPSSGDTTWSFNRSNQWTLSSTFLSQVPSGIGSFRTLEALAGVGTDGITNLCEPWQRRLTSDVSWNGVNWSTSLEIIQIRPFTTTTSPYIYADQSFATSWPAASSPLSTAIPNATQTTITMTSAATEIAGSTPGPIFYGIMIAIGGQGGTGTLEYMRCLGSSGTTVTVARGQAFNGVNTTAVPHSAGEIIYLAGRYAWSTIPSLPNWWGGSGHQTFEVVCSAPHKMKSGLQIGGIPNGYSGVVDTNGHALTSSYGFNGIVLVTGATTLVVSGWNSGYNSYSAATITTTYNIPSPVVNYTNNLPGSVIPIEAAAQLVSLFPNCNLHLDIPMLASDSYVYLAAIKVLANLTPGRKVYIELGNEPWGNTWFTQVLQQYLSPICGYTGDGYSWYIVRTGQIVTMIKNVFATAGRQAEVHSYVCAGPTGNQYLNDAITLGVEIDAVGIAPYASLSSDNTTTVFCNSATPSQVADLFIHQIYYLANVASPGNPAGIVSEIASYNSTYGYNCQLYSYEGGYSIGCSTNSYSLTNDDGWYNWNMSSDVRYMPVWRIYEKDYFAWVQTSGWQTLHIYALSLYYYYQNCWNIYTWPYQQPGIGDGSDGKQDNRKILQSVGYNGPIYYTAGYIGPGSGTISVINGSTTVNFALSQTLVKGNWIVVDGDITATKWFIVSGSGTGPYTIETGISSPTSYSGSTNTTATWVYGIAVDQDASAVSVRGQALSEWNALIGVVTTTLTGPTTGVLGSKSTAFTVTLSTPAGPGGVIVIPSSSVGSDYFTSS